ncbi:hypothetical protein EVAR_19577_1 [Eumeta japonica]|uniref:Uncharacterized protein n=1 Tax=Eumeta variegata TaxID=151549 RepID=A0A4C1UG53_EUMVA|nr:hypothetical protein EVAR_19577_1 [Eumeta japonica]
MLTSFKESASDFVWHIVSSNENCIYCYEPKTKQQSTVWVYRDESKPTKVARKTPASGGGVGTARAAASPRLKSLQIFRCTKWVGRGKGTQCGAINFAPRES